MEKGETTAERVGGYRVIRRLATGGTSDVLLAKAEGPHGFERTVVLKLLLSQYRNDDDFGKMFAREAAAYARLSHPSIVRLFDFFSLDTQLVMVLEYIDGPPLSRLRGMLKAVGHQLDDRAAIHVGARIFDALAAAHGAIDAEGKAAPVIHRDVNPSNVLIPWDGHVKLADFGVAKVTGLNHQSVAGMIKGTFGYMAPEQVTGESPITPRADVYAGGILLWELLARRRAFQRGALPEMEVLRAMAEPHITSIDVIRPDVDKSVRDAIKRALEPRPEKRTVTAEEMVSILRTFVPTDEGRERLASMLSMVRHEPRPALSTHPPPTVDAPRSAVDELAATMPKPPLAPSLGDTLPTTPRPIAPVSVPSPSPSPLGRSVLPRAATSQRPVAPRMTPSHGITAVASPPPPPAGPPKPTTKLPTGTAKLSQAQPPPPPMTNPPTSSQREVPAFDSLIEPPELVQVTGRESEKRRMVASLEGVAPGLGLRDAIDEILRAQPSSVPPALFEAQTPRMGELPQAPPPLTATLPLGATKTKSGELPPINPPPVPPSKRSSERAIPIPAPPRPRMKSSANDITLAAPTPLADPHPMSMPESEVVRSSLAPDARALNIQASIDDALAKGTIDEAVASTALAPPLAPPPNKPEPPLTPPTPESFPALDRTIAMASVPVKPDDIPTVVPPPSDVPARVETVVLPAVVHTATAPMPARPAPPPAPPPLVPSAPALMAAPPASGPPLHSPPPPPIRATAPSFPSAPGISTSPERSGAPLPPPPKSASSAGLIVFVLVLVIALGVAGTVGYLRWQKSAAHPVPTTPPTAANASPSASVAVAPPVSASASATTAAASASASLAGSATVAPPTDAPDAGAADVPEGMGILKTTGTAPHRRIFVDEKVVGQTPDSATVKCGTHAVRLGSAGKAQTVEIPCGGEITVGDVPAPAPKPAP